jgi:hypothetical protein
MEHCVVERFSVTLSFSGKFFFNKNPQDCTFVCTLLSIFSRPSMLGNVGHMLQLVFFVGPKTISGRLCCSYRANGSDVLHHLTRWIILHFLMNFYLFFLIFQNRCFCSFWISPLVVFVRSCLIYNLMSCNFYFNKMMAHSVGLANLFQVNQTGFSTL